MAFEDGDGLFDRVVLSSDYQFLSESSNLLRFTLLILQKFRVHVFLLSNFGLQLCNSALYVNA
jgi:hypothetical protein